jgi:hypothetical protein
MKMTSMKMITMTSRHQMISQSKAMMMHLAIAPMLCRLTPFEKDRQNKNPMIGWQAIMCSHPSIGSFAI